MYQYCISFLLLNDTLLYGYTTFSLSIRKLKGVWIVYHFLAIMSYSAMNIHIQVFCVHLLLFLLGIYLRVGLLGKW